jgi:hypothetical protein
MAFALLAVLLGLTALQLARGLRRAEVDWGGVAFAIGFVALAFYLNHVTGLG